MTRVSATFLLNTETCQVTPDPSPHNAPVLWKGLIFETSKGSGLLCVVIGKGSGFLCVTFGKGYGFMCVMIGKGSVFLCMCVAICKRSGFLYVVIGKGSDLMVEGLASCV